MAHVAGISKTERKKAIARIVAFTKEFAALPEHRINLDSWYYYPNGVYAPCGSVGCVGGYAAHSPLMQKYISKPFNPQDTFIEDEVLYSFFGVTTKQGNARKLFAPRVSTKTQEVYSDKQEGLDRLKRLEKWHRAQLVK